MTQKIWWGFPFTTQGQLYGGTAPYIAESAVTGSNGLGARMAARKYDRDPSSVFANSTAADVVAHNRGVRMFTSVSNPTQAGFTYDKATNGVSAGVGLWDAAWNSLFARIKPGGASNMKYNTAVDSAGVGSFGGLTQPDFSFCIQHEVDNPNHQSWGTPMQFKAYVRHLHNLAVAAGARQYFKLNLCVMSFGIPLGRCDQYITGITDIVDEIGLDFYNDFTASWTYDGSVSQFASSFAPSLAFVRKYGLPFNCPEFSQAESGNDAAMQAWFEGVATTLNAATDVVCNGIYMWSQASSAYQNSNKTAGQDPATSTAHLGKHTGILNAMNATGGNTPPSVAPSSPPTAPTNVHVVSLGSDGTSAVIGWDAAPAFTPTISALRWYQATGITQSLPNVGGDLAVANTHTITGLTPGGKYTVAPTWKNSAGNSGYGATSDGVTLLSFTTPTPGPTNHSPQISSATATPDASDPTLIHLVASRSDPFALTLTDKWLVTDPSGAITELDAASGDETFTSSGNYRFSYTATNSSGLSTTVTGNFAVTTGSSVTPNFGWGLPIQGPSGTLARGLGPLLRGFMRDLDKRLKPAVYAKNSHNAIQGLAASTFNGHEASGTNVVTPAASDFVYASMRMEDDTIASLTTVTSVAMAGTGIKVGIYDANGNLDPAGPMTGLEALLTATAGAVPPVALPASILSFAPGDVFIVGIWFPPSGITTFPQIRAATAGGVFAYVNKAAAPTFGKIPSLSDLPTVIAFASNVSNLLPYFAVPVAS